MQDGSERMNEMLGKQECILVSCLDGKMPERLPSFPRHLTLLQWFSFSEPVDLAQLTQSIGTIVGNSEPIVLTGGDEAQFGPSGEVRVRLVELTPALRQVHAALLGTIVQYGGHVRRSQYVGDNYRPHVSYQDDGGLAAEESVELTHVQLIQAVREGEYNRRVLGQWVIGASND